VAWHSSPAPDDIREAPELTLIDQLLQAGATVSATDQVAIPGVRKLLGRQGRVESSSYACARGDDALALVTE